MTNIPLLALAGIVLAGCGTSRTSSPPPAQHRGPHYPIIIHEPVVVRPAPRSRQDGSGDSIRFVSPTRLGIVTWGSSSCPSIPDDLTILGPNTISFATGGGHFFFGRAASLGRSYICTADLSPTRMLVTIDPKLIDAHLPLTVVGWYAMGGRAPRDLTVPPLES
jgi:hypothetical protein